jgi:Mor family transcriptional regulator
MDEKLKVEDLRIEQQQIVETIGLDSYMQLSKRFGGTMLYVAKAEDLLEKKRRDAKIREEFNGGNYSQLALKFGLTESWIRTIVHDKAEEIRKKPIDGQMNVFDFLERKQQNA